MNLPADVRLVRKSQVEMRPIDTGAVLVDMRSGACFELNRTGVEVWELLTNACTIGSIATVLEERYRIAREVVIADVTRVADVLAKQGLVTMLTQGGRPG